ncbi:MAG TPA: MlaD family protein [Spirochaetota bacterium]|nr:MlaD family protein [Spirochaetota bacterium]HPI90739.1 MlaD family protein [Spirochaetota bacterium]HPR46357.1 MlaD family protein [Spirochaetota bacterium]
MKQMSKNELRVGLFILIPVAFLFVFIMLKLGYSIAGSTKDIYLKIDSISSVSKGTQIKIKGYTIGRVVDIKPVYKPALHFLAVLRVNNDIELYEDCSAVIQNQNIIGDSVIELRNPDKKGALLRENDVIEGFEYVNLESILQDVHILLTNLTGTVDVVKQIAMESRHNVRSLLDDLSTSVATVNKVLDDSQKDILSILASFRVTAKTMAEISEELKKHPIKFLTQGKKD